MIIYINKLFCQLYRQLEQSRSEERETSSHLFVNVSYCRARRKMVESALSATTA